MLRNKPGQLAVVVPMESACDDIKAHGGKIVTPVKLVPCDIGPVGPAWLVEPELLDKYGHPIGWDDHDLKPLGEPPAGEQEETDVDVPRLTETAA